ncbi:MAG: sulfurtransferase TusA family protein [Actinomycetota bacterium]
MDTIQPSTASDTTRKIDATVDARGQSCPGPIVALAKALKSRGAGDVVELLASDPGSKTDVPAWAKLSGNELLEATASDGRFRYLIRVR